MKSSFSTFLESLLLPLRTKEPRKDLLFSEMLSKSEDVEPVLKMTPPASGIELKELKEHRELMDSWEPFLIMVEIEQLDFPKDLVESAGLLNIKIVGKSERSVEAILKPDKPYARVRIIRQTLSKFPLFSFFGVLSFT